MIYERKNTCFFYPCKTFANFNFQNELVLRIANSAKMNGNLGGKLLVQKMLLSNEFIVHNILNYNLSSNTVFHALKG